MKENRSNTIAVRLTDKESRRLKTYCQDTNKTLSFALREGLITLAQSTERYSGSGEVQPDNNR